MRMVLLSLAAALAGSPALGAPSVQGLWRTATGGGVIEMHPCGEALCGRVVDSSELHARPNQTDDGNRSPGLRGRSIKGLEILQDLKGGPTEWKDGAIYDPQDGKIYRASLKVLDAESMRITGCLVYPLCGSQVWTRVK